MQMDDETKKILALNVELLMRYHGLTQEKLAIKARVHQKTISNILNIEATINGSTIGNIESVAKVFDLKAWHLLVPNQPIDTLISQSMEKLIDNYTAIDGDGRQNIDRISENEVRYCSQNELHNDKHKNGQ